MFFPPWEPKSLMDVFILMEHRQTFDVIKHADFTLSEWVGPFML